MPDNQNKNLDRWQALDAIKTLGLLGAISGHILVWWFGKNLDTKSGDVFFSLSGMPNWLIVVYLTVVHFILMAAGASFYFYLKKYNPTFKKIIYRTALLVLLGILFGLNLHPLALFWNVFLFYALSILIIFILDRYSNRKTIFFLTLCVLALTPLLRLFLNKIFPENYLSVILIGDPLGRISFYPLFPWFFLVGAGFLTSHFYSQYQNKRFSSYGLFGGAIGSLSIVPFLKPLDLSNVFGATSQISIAYIIFIFSSFIFFISLAERIFEKITLSKYNSVIAIGRHILPVYLITIAITLPLTNALKSSGKYNRDIYIFLGLQIIAFAIACLTAALLTLRSSKHAQ